MLERYCKGPTSSPPPSSSSHTRWFGTNRSRVTQEVVDADPDKECWKNLPVGAEHQIRQIAAEMILEQLLNKVNERESVDHTAIFNVVSEFPGTCQRSYQLLWEDGSQREMLPLAIICCLRPPLKTVQAVYEAYPNAVFVPEGCKNSLPLHLASAFEASLDVVKFIYSQNTAAISSSRNDGVYPLHLACGFYLGDPSVIDFLMDKFPEGAQKVCLDNQWTPFHSAAHGGISDANVLQRLLDLEPNAIDQVDKHGRTALHLACRSRHGNQKIIEFLVRTQPASLAMEDHLDRWTPLFLASFSQSLESIETILDLMPLGTPVVNAAGGTSLLHWAAIGNTAKVVDMLARRFPEMLSMQTTDGAKDSPLACAIDNEAPLENILTLIEHYPRALFLKDGADRRPLVSARFNRANKEVIRLLEASERRHGHMLSCLVHRVKLS